MRRLRHSAMIDRQREMRTPLASRIPMASLIQTLAVAEYLNVCHAANALGVSRSSVSARVKGLPHPGLGTILFFGERISLSFHNSRV